ncbi:MAG: dephospho-CoA kinase, partial [Dorea sp.]
MMKVIGITGGVGAGKSQVLEYLSNRYGATVCMADDVAKKLQKKGGECFAPIVEHFGEEILDEEGELNRSKLAGIVFTNNEELEVLNNIVHPAVKTEVKRIMNEEAQKGTDLFVLESALLVE